MRRHEAGTFVGYISQTDPRGKLPPWLVNKVTQKFAPRVVKQLKKAAEGYELWKMNQSDPHMKPWAYPEQTIMSPRISINDVNMQQKSVFGNKYHLFMFLQCVASESVTSLSVCDDDSNTD